MRLIEADCRDAMATMEAASVDCVVTDPPYEIDMMRQSWDREGNAFDARTWEQVARVAKPGAWIAAFGGRRTWHRMVVAAEDAGLDIRDSLMWLYTTGNVTAKNTTLKTAWEPIMLAQVPSPKSLAKTVDEYGTGYLNIDDCRLPYLDEEDLAKTKAKNPGRDETFTSGVYGTNRPQQLVNAEGRHPANVFMDPEVADMLGRDQRFFLVPKASRRERDAGLSLEACGFDRNPHTAVKPVALMEWLIRLICPAGGTVLDAFMGSGTTGIAAVHEGRDFIGIEREAIYVATSRARIDHAISTLKEDTPCPASSQTL